jgi:hypothetical protein
MVAPVPLVMAQERLDEINHNTELKEKVLFEWSKISHNDLENLKVPATNEVNMQLRRLRDFQIYLQFKSDQFMRHKTDLSLG